MDGQQIGAREFYLETSEKAHGYCPILLHLPAAPPGPR